MFLVTRLDFAALVWKEEDMASRDERRFAVRYLLLRKLVRRGDGKSAAVFTKVLCYPCASLACGVGDPYRGSVFDSSW